MLPEASASRHRFFNVLRFEMAAGDRLACSSWGAIPTDEEGGFAFVKITDLNRIQNDLLASPWHRPLAACNLELMWRLVVSHYKKLAAALVKVTDRVSVSLLCSSLAGGTKTFPANVQHTCKTHNEYGQVAFRPIHPSFMHAYTGLISLVAMVLLAKC